MRKTTLIHYDQMDVQKIVRNELDRAKPEWIEEMVNRVSKDVSEKFDKVMTVLDKFVGEIKSYREEQALTSGRLSKHTGELEQLDKRLQKLEHTFA